MIKEGRIILTSLILLVLTVSFIIAVSFDATVTPTSVDEDTSYLFNFTVVNTNSTANISEVNITLPTDFTLTSTTNGTSVSGTTFSNTSSILTWNKTSLIENDSTQYFWFNATAATPGTYNFTITTFDSSSISASNETNTITVNDTTSPSSIEFISPSPANGTSLSQTSIPINISANDSYSNIDTIRIYLYNSTGLVNNTNVSATGGANATGYINFTSLTDGTYYINSSANDSAGNQNLTGPTRTIILDASSPVITLIAPADSTSSTTSAYNFTFNVTDDQTVSNCSLILDDSVIHVLTTVNNTGGTNGMYNSSLSVATHTWSVNCTDSVGNTGNSSSRTLIVSSSTSTTSTSEGTGGYPNYLPNEDELSQGYNKVLYKNWKISFNVKEILHALEIDDITETTVKFTISSEPQEATLSIGQEERFELSGDDVYDLLVELNSIDYTNNLAPKANITITAISEDIKEATTIQQDIDEKDLIDEEKPDKDLTWLWILIIVVVIVLIIVGYKKLKK